MSDHIVKIVNRAEDVQQNSEDTHSKLRRKSVGFDPKIIPPRKVLHPHPPER